MLTNTYDPPAESNFSDEHGIAPNLSVIVHGHGLSFLPPSRLTVFSIWTFLTSCGAKYIYRDFNFSLLETIWKMVEENCTHTCHERKTNPVATKLWLQSSHNQHWPNKGKELLGHMFHSLLGLCRLCSAVRSVRLDCVCIHVLRITIENWTYKYFTAW
jgi:hypothetical protein